PAHEVEVEEPRLERDRHAVLARRVDAGGARRAPLELRREELAPLPPSDRAVLPVGPRIERGVEPLAARAPGRSLARDGRDSLVAREPAEVVPEEHVDASLEDERVGRAGLAPERERAR